jgi:hypothetical protein
MNSQARKSIMHRVPILCPGPSEKLELYEKLVATNPKIQRKGATVPYISLNGHMFSNLSKDGKLALRLPAEEREAFLKNLVAVTSQAHRGCLSPRRCRAALPSGVARLESHRHKVLPSWLPSCRSRTLF